MKLPQPGAIGIFCAGAGRVRVMRGATKAFRELREGQNGILRRRPVERPARRSYQSPRAVGPLPAIAHHHEHARISPWVSAIVTHQRLDEAGVTSQLFVYDGLNHYFCADTGLPESRPTCSTQSRGSWN